MGHVHFFNYPIFNFSRNKEIEILTLILSIYFSSLSLSLFTCPIWNGQAFEELEDLLAKHNICIAVKEKLVKDSGVAEQIAYDNIVQKLLTKPRARGKFF